MPHSRVYSGRAVESEKIIIIDGSSYIFRAYYAIQRLSNSKGFPTNAIYGFIQMLMKVLEVEKPTKLLIAFDTGRATFRKERYADYKANRQAPPDDLKVQFEPIQRAVDCFGVNRLQAEGFEADDVIATVARKAAGEGYRVEIITGDKDLMQLVTDKITIYDTMKDKRYDSAGVKEKMSVTPEQIVDLLALMGDSSDNIPGVNGIGPKTAVELIERFGSLDGIYEHLTEISQQKRRETLEKEKDVAYLSKELATVRDDVPLKMSWADMDYKGPRLTELRKLFEEYEFQALIKRFDFKADKADFVPGKYSCVQDEAALRDVVQKLESSKILAVDTETTSLQTHRAKLVGISLSGHSGEAYYVPVGHHALGEPDNLLAGQIPADVVRRHLKPLLENAKIPKVGQNLKYDLQILRRFGIEICGIVSDTLIASYLLDPEQPHNLDALAFRVLGHSNITYEDVTGKGRNQVNFAEVTIDKACSYAAEDADVTLRIHEKLLPQLKEKGLLELYQNVELPLMQVLADMEYQGVLVDAELLTRISAELAGEMAQTEKKIFDLAGEPLNINSPKQLSKILFEKLKLPALRKTKTGFSTDESVLNELAEKHDICKWIVKFRELAKLRSTYAEGLLAEINEETKRVHTHYNQTVAATGRLSSSSPNLQNIPVGNETRYDIRSVFTAAPGHEFVSADYSQVELRILAAMSGDPALKKAFEANEDIHELTAKFVFNVDKPTKEQRSTAKTINFGVTYGQTAYGLSQMLKISPGEAKQFIDTYFQKYAKVKAFYQGLIEGARETGYVSTYLGRRRYFPEINASNRMRREMAERGAINAPVQGTAADLIKVAMVNLKKRLVEEKLQTRLILQVHDELLLEVPVAEKAMAEKILVESMETALPLGIPLRVDVGWGKTWKECDG